MGFFDFMKRPDINQGLQECRSVPGAVLVDVRSSREYREGHIPGSLNLPLEIIDSAPSVLKDREAPLYVYCYSGARSAQAARVLVSMGFRNVKNIGGIASYSGPVEC